MKKKGKVVIAICISLVLTGCAGFIGGSIEAQSRFEKAKAEDTPDAY